MENLEKNAPLSYGAWRSDQDSGTAKRSSNRASVCGSVFEMAAVGSSFWASVLSILEKATFPGAERSTLRQSMSSRSFSWAKVGSDSRRVFWSKARNATSV